MAGPAQVCIVHGSDTWLVQDQSQRLVAEWKKIFPTTSIETLSPPISLNQLRQNLTTMTFFSTPRIVLVDDAQDLLKLEAEGIKTLASIHQLMDTNIRIIYRSGKDLGKSAAAKMFLGLGQVLSCPPLTEWQQDQAQRELIAFAKARGKALQIPAASILLAWLGTHRASLYNELSKAITYGGERTTVTEADVAAVSSPSHIAPFALTDALLQKNKERFFKELGKRLEDDYPLSLLSLLAGQFRLLLQIWEQKQLSPSAIAANIGKSEFVVKKTVPAIRHWSQDQCYRALRLLHQTDVDLKTGCGDPGALMILRCAQCWT